MTDPKENINQDDENLAKGRQPTEQNAPDPERVETVIPDNDSGEPGVPADDDSSNKGQGPSVENL